MRSFTLNTSRVLTMWHETGMVSHEGFTRRRDIRKGKKGKHLLDYAFDFCFLFLELACVAERHIAVGHPHLHNSYTLQQLLSTLVRAHLTEWLKSISHPLRSGSGPSHSVVKIYITSSPLWFRPVPQHVKIYIMSSPLLSRPVSQWN